jgi:hypothetical protein
MKNKIKKILRQFVPRKILHFRSQLQSKKQIKDWERRGCPVPTPHIIKQIIVGEYQRKYGYTTFIETGTFMGDMVEAQRKRFKRIYSIELGDDLFRKAKRRFEKDKKITIVHGDSGKVLPQILNKISEPAIFWLDGHYSAGITAKGDKDCPIFEELNAIFDSKRYNHIILIDDAQYFTGVGDYPTIMQLKEYVYSKEEKYQIEVKQDIIRFVIE